MTHVSPQVLVIGLDGASLDTLLPWIEEGNLPTLTELLNTGVYGRLKTTIPMVTPTAWSSFMTGMNPGKHGITGFVIYDREGRPTVASARNRRGEEIWSILSRHGKRVIVVNVPMIYPPKPVNGILISGFPAPPRGYTYPPWLERELRLITGARKALHMIGITPENLYCLLSRLHLASLRQKVGKKMRRWLLSRIFLSSRDVDWENTLAFSLGAMGQIFINRRRVRSKAAYQQLRKYLVVLLKSPRDESTGESVVEVFMKEQIYRGPLMPRMPDIIFVPRPRLFLI